MANTYSIPVLALLCALLAVFGALEARVRSARTLLWLLGWTLTALQLVLLQFSHQSHGLLPAIADTSIQLAAVMFLGSLSPLKFQRIRLHYVTAYAIPLLFCAFLSSLISVPNATVRGFFVLSVIAAVLIGVGWSLRKNLLPAWLTTLSTLIFGALCLGFAVSGQYGNVQRIALAANASMSAILVIAAYRRCSPGVCLTVSGLLLWSLPALIGATTLPEHAPGSLIWMARAFNLAKVIAALGMIVLVLEDELAAHEAAQQRDRRSRIELEQYSRVHCVMPSAEDMSHIYETVCQTITAHSRFRQAALLLQSVEGGFSLKSSSGLDPETQHILSRVGERMSAENLRALVGQQSFDLGHAQQVDLSPLLVAAELRRTRFLKPFVMTIHTRNGQLDGLLLLTDVSHPARMVHTEELLPLELLVARLTSARQHQHLIRQLSQTEKLSSLGQLAGGIAHELNNPLTVVMGYAELLQEGGNDVPAQHYGGIILSEARRMKHIVENLSRFWRPSAALMGESNLSVLVREIENQRAPELTAKGINLRIDIAADLRPVLASGEQLKQVLAQLIEHAESALDSQGSYGQREICIDLRQVAQTVQLLVTDNGPGFTDPERAFDPFSTHEGMGLSLCYTVIREHGGEIVAYNREPRGAAILIKLPTREPELLPDLAAEMVSQ